MKDTDGHVEQLTLVGATRKPVFGQNEGYHLIAHNCQAFVAIGNKVCSTIRDARACNLEGLPAKMSVIEVVPDDVFTG